METKEEKFAALFIGHKSKVSDPPEGKITDQDATQSVISAQRQGALDSCALTHTPGAEHFDAFMRKMLPILAMGAELFIRENKIAEDEEQSHRVLENYLLGVGMTLLTMVTSKRYMEKFTTAEMSAVTLELVRSQLREALTERAGETDSDSIQMAAAFLGTYPEDQRDSLLLEWLRAAVQYLPSSQQGMASSMLDEIEQEENSESIPSLTAPGGALDLLREVPAGALTTNQDFGAIPLDNPNPTREELAKHLSGEIGRPYEEVLAALQEVNMDDIMAGKPVLLKIPKRKPQ